MKALIVAAGKIDDYNHLRKIVKEHDFILCADKGLDHLRKIQLLPDLVVGDLDSLSAEGIKLIEDKGIEVLKYPSRKDKSDSELALDFILERDFLEVSMIGVLGGRWDHTLSVISLLRKINKSGLIGRIIDETNSISYLAGKRRVKKTDKTFISIIPLSLQGIHLSLKGFSYDLDRDYIEFSSTKGISNEIVGEFADIELHEGEALLIESKDK